MKKFLKVVFRLSVFTLLVAGWSVAAGALHVVLSPGQLPVVGKVTVLPKDHFALRDTFVDTRKWTVEDVAKHPALAARLGATNKADVLKHVGFTTIDAHAHDGIQAGLLASPADGH